MSNNPEAPHEKPTGQKVVSLDINKMRANFMKGLEKDLQQEIAKRAERAQDHKHDGAAR